MWQLERAAVSISSGSTASTTAHLPTTCGEAEPGSVTPPSKLAVWPRLYRPRAKSSPSFKVQVMSAVKVDILAPPLGSLRLAPKGRRGMMHGEPDGCLGRGGPGDT